MLSITFARDQPTQINVAEIPYLNSAPFFWQKTKNAAGIRSTDIRWLRVHPKEMGRLAKSGQVQAGPLSLVDSFALEDQFEPLSGLGIAVKKSAMSVLLMSKCSLSGLKGKTVGLTTASVTSVRLLQIILEKRHGVKPRYRTGFKDSDAARLLIGDEALKEAVHPKTLKVYPWVIDLGEEWHQWQNLPFVFARWMIRKDCSPHAKRVLYGHLIRNLKFYKNNGQGVLQWYKTVNRWICKDAEKYLQEFKYRLGEREKRAISVFRKLIQA